MAHWPGYTLHQTLHDSPRSTLARATRLSDGCSVILKFPSDGQSSPRRALELQREFAIARRIEGDGILRVLGLETFPERVALVLEDFGGTSLRHLLDARGPLEVDTFLDYALHICEALGHIHQRGVIHKDLKPQNIIVNPSTGVVKIADFSLSAAIALETATPETPSHLTGTLAYMAPEQTGRMNRGVDYRADFYALGATFFELLTGRRVFTSQVPLELLHAHVAQVPPSPREVIPGLPEPLAALVLKLLSKDPEARYQSAWGLIADVKECLRQLREHCTLTSFPLGAEDRAQQFRLPQGLYGRASDVAFLVETHARAAAGRCQVLLITGSAGIGKSSLVNELHRVTAASRGRFAAGKCDQLHRSVPFDAVHQALSQLVRQTLSEGETEARRVCERLREALGANVAVLVEAIPDTRALLGEQPPPVPLPADASKNRLTLVLARAIQAFAAPERPLALFLDDLQWADSATLSLLQVLAREPDTRHLLLVGAYRDTDISAAHPLPLMLDELRAAGTPLRSLHLTPLGIEEVAQMVRETTAASPERALELGRFVHARTGGNPFSVKAFLRFLHEQELLRFDTQAGRWEWEFARLEAREIPDDVAALMAAEIRQLPAETVELLQLAACLGVSFGFRDLTVASGATAERTAHALWSAIQRGLVLPLSQDYLLLEPYGARAAADLEVPLRFLHDRVRQAAYSLIAPEERAEWHVRAGLRLLEEARAAGTLEERLFAILPHLGHAPERIGPASLRLELVDLHLKAGRRAKASGAYRTACELFRTGSALLPADAWVQEHERAFSLQMELAESHYLAGEFEAAASGFSTLLTRARAPAQRAGVHAMQAMLASVRGRHAETLRLGLDGLRLLGVDLPLEPDQAAIAAELQAVMGRLGGREPALLLDLPRVNDPGVELSIHVLASMTTSAYLSNQGLFALLVLRIVRLSLEHGNSRFSPFGYVTFGIILAVTLGEPFMGWRFGQLASEMAARFEDPMMQARLRYVRAAHIDLWTQSARAGISELAEAYKGSLESGDWQHAGLCRVAQLWRRVSMGGEPLSEVLEENRKLLKFLETSKDPETEAMALCLQRLVLTLMGAGQEAPEYIPGSDGYTWRVTLHMGAAKLLYLLRQPEQALVEAEKAQPYMPFLSGLFHEVTYTFYHALIAAAVYPGAPGEKQEALLAQVERQCAYLERCAQRAPENFSAYHLLVCAELARIKGQEAELPTQYERAIATARANGFANLEALANELAFRFHLDRGHRAPASAYLLEALDAYARWGATEKVRLLTREQSALLRAHAATLARWEPRHVERLDSSSISRSSSSSSSDSLVETLDMSSVMKASQAISGELLLPQLVANLIHIVMESAGAQRGVLVLKHGEELFVEAAGEMGSRGGQLSPVQPLERSDSLCIAIAQQVLRSGTPVLIDDASAQATLRENPYISSHGVRSVLCAPILHRRQLLGLFYLENNLTPGAFNSSRLHVLGMLSAQAAISIENAGLYGKLEGYSHALEQRVHERTDELHRKNAELQRTLRTLQAMQAQIITQEKLASLGALTAGIAHELKNPLNFVNNFSQLSLELLREVREGLDGAWPGAAAQREEFVSLLGELEQNTTRVREHGQRASGIIDGMLRHARGNRGERRPTHINPLVGEVIRLVQHGLGARNPPIHVRIETGFDAAMPQLSLVAEDLRRVILNLMDNACYAAHQKARQAATPFQPEVRVSTHWSGSEVEIRVRDNGNGIPAAVRDKLFTPFFTTKPPGEGTGLGLSISHDIVVVAQGGRLTVESREGEYAEFIITLPAIPRQHTQQS
ncbi:serine/threonine protein kinase [Archangium sp. Cb G35]|uniref:trifunctional serine/threonine-protein kinase/ATP-binding protein/sensor histidine kinase n=1 Tax=Archangium sp. Cb G35 TaxID=1920190 RepID=UPI0009375284|nr:ATP-binding sensor histidine kinase [Archangium sp. Cb G35]OJT17805.1 serine/threonine protein kinase [Archangium sp. Cb G35]